MPENTYGRFLPWLPALIWAALIFCGSSIPGADIKPWLIFQDKVLHTLVYLILGILLLRAFYKATPSLSDQKKYLFSFILVLFYGITDELHQAFVPLRDPSFLDVCFDALGGFLAVLFFHFK